jgi:hypothetical protein
MEIVTEASEQALGDMLRLIQARPEDWMSLHVNIAPMHKQMMSQEGLSDKVLAKIRAISMQIAHKLDASGLSAFDGKIMVFEDSDVQALFAKASSPGLDAMLSHLRCEFTKCGMNEMLVIEEMKDRLSQVLSFGCDRPSASNLGKM